MEQQDKEEVLTRRRRDSLRAADMIYEGGSLDTSAPPGQAASFAPIDPSAHLPRLKNVAQMAPDARHAALAHWVAWFNSHRNKVSPELEIDLTRALEAMDRISTSGEEANEIQRSFDSWLSSLPEDIF